jgi:hypothetical protein
MSAPIEARLISAAALAAAMDCSESKARELINAGDMPSVKYCGLRRVRVEDLDMVIGDLVPDLMSPEALETYRERLAAYRERQREASTKPADGKPELRIVRQRA